MAKGKKDVAKASKGAKAGKKDKGAKKSGSAGAAKKSRIPQPVQGRAFAWVGLLALGSIALLLLNGTLTIEAAATRAGIVLVVLMVLERVVAPVVWTIVSGENRADDPSSNDDGAEATREHTGA
ncbi:MAG: hypothetical protein QOG60_1787 [Frankiaceae bacterium]|nr:hypothetical protein [Frankiaceae bacterium]MDQ1672674.1 hypothetical protein [Frankiaceae bacterium]